VYCGAVLYTPLPTPKTLYIRGQILSELVKAKVSFENRVVSHSGMVLPLFMKCLFLDIKTISSSTCATYTCRAGHGYSPCRQYEQIFIYPTNSRDLLHLTPFHLYFLIFNRGWKANFRVDSEIRRSLNKFQERFPFTMILFEFGLWLVLKFNDDIPISSFPF
jgi:hypothetical protein